VVHHVGHGVVHFERSNGAHSDFSYSSDSHQVHSWLSNELRVHNPVRYSAKCVTDELRGTKQVPLKWSFPMRAIFRPCTHKNKQTNRIQNTTLKHNHAIRLLQR
jgi:hypothetical protein